MSLPYSRDCVKMANLDTKHDSPSIAYGVAGPAQKALRTVSLEDAVYTGQLKSHEELSLSSEDIASRRLD